MQPHPRIILEVFSDYVWTWCYLCTVRVEKLLATFDIDVEYKHFPLHPNTPEEGLTLETLFAGRDFDILAAQNRIAGLMADEGLSYGTRTMTYNSRLAQELASREPSGTNSYTNSCPKPVRQDATSEVPRCRSQTSTMG